MSLLSHIRLCSLDHYSTLNALSLQPAADLIRVIDSACKIVGIRGAPPAAVESRKTGTALFLRVDVHFLEFFYNIGPRHTAVYIAKQEILCAYKLMTGVKITPGRDRKILCAASAAG